MSTTLNLNETAKVKHILALAQGINNKLDGNGSAIELVTVTPSAPKPTGTITLSQTTMTLADFKSSSGANISFTYNGDGDIYVTSESTQYAYSIANNTLSIVNTASSASLTGASFTLYAPETTNYTEAEATFTITA